MFGWSQRNATWWRLVVVLILSGSVSAAAQVASREEVPLTFSVPRLISQEIIVWYDGDQLFLPMLEVFGLLSVDARYDSDRNTISGFFLEQEREFALALRTARLTTWEKQQFLAPSEAIVVSPEVYLRSDLYAEFFGLEFTFDFAELSITLPFDSTFPAWERIERERRRTRLLAQEEQLGRVTPLATVRPWLGGAVLDWSLSTTPYGPGNELYSGQLGAVVAKGDLEVGFTGDSRRGIDADALNGRWRFVVDRTPYLGQVLLGDVNATGSIGRGLRGAALTNRPVVPRRYFQTIEIAGTTGPDWEVELYVGGRLVDFQTTGPSGRYRFSVDVDYGGSIIEVRKFGPNGEQETEQRYLQVPFDLVPEGELEYQAVAGEDRFGSDSGWYALGNIAYGVAPNVTLGVGVEHLLSGDSSVSPQLAASLSGQLTGNVTAAARWLPRRSIGGNLLLTMPASVSASLSHSRYFDRSDELARGLVSETDLTLSTPLRIAGQQVSARYNLAFDQFDERAVYRMYASVGVSTRYAFLSALGRYSGASDIDGPIENRIQLIASIQRLRLARPLLRFEYDLLTKRVTSYGIDVSRSVLGTSQLTLSYRESPLAGSRSVGLTFTYLTDFAQTTARASSSTRQTVVTTSHRGSIQWDQATGGVHLSRRAGVGRGHARLRPFLDYDADGTIDAGEPLVETATARLWRSTGRPAGGRRRTHPGLQAYDSYVLQVDPTSLPDPLTRPLFDDVAIDVMPNMVTAVDVPVVVAADISGVVERQSTSGRLGIGGLRIQMINLGRDQLTEISTFTTGDYYHLGLIPGRYRIQLDPEQLGQLGYQSEPASHEVIVPAGADPISLEQINFLLLPTTALPR